MRLKIEINEGNGYDSTQEFIIDPAGFLHVAGESQLTATEFVDLGELSARFNKSSLDKAETQIERLEKLAKFIDEILYAMGPQAKNKTVIKEWRATINSIAESLREALSDLDSQGRTVGGTLEVIRD